MLEQFNLPKYIDGLSFSDASKKIQSRFKDRVDRESIETEKEMLGRLRDMQEFVKSQNEQKKEQDLDKTRDPNAMIAGDSKDDISDISSQESENIDGEDGMEQNAYGGYQNNKSLALFKEDDYIPPTYEQLYAPTVGEGDIPIQDSIMSLAGTAISMYAGSGSGTVSDNNKFWSGGYQDEYSNMFNNAPNQPQVQAQDTVKMPQQETKAQDTVKNSSSNGSGMMSSITGALGSSGGSAGGYATLGKNTLSLGQEAFGSTNVNTTGVVKVKTKKAGNSALSGAAKGATAGAVLGPWGAAAGAVVGAAAGFIGANKHNKAAAVANRNATYADASKNDNQFAKGGKINKEDEDGLLSTFLKESAEYNLYDSLKNNKKVRTSDMLGVIPTIPSQIASFVLERTTEDKENFKKFNDNKNRGKKILPRNIPTNTRVKDNIYAMGGNVNEYAKGGKTKPKTREKILPVDVYTAGLKDMQNPLLSSTADIYGYPGEVKDISTLNKIKNGALDAGSKVYDFALNNTDALRYAPAISNALQLANLKEPEQETTATLNNRYNKQLVDENALLNLTREETNANREAILGATAGSDSAARANLLGTQLNSTKAISDAYLKASEMNSQEARQEQSFNLNVDQINLGQDNLAKDIRARNKGNYETQKSMLQSAVATDLGSIGQEELYKKFPELLGMDYDWKGEYKKLKEKEDKSKKK